MSGNLVPLEEAWSFVLGACGPRPAVPTALADALGRVLAVDAASDTTVPPFANSAMDGYSVVAAD